MCLPSLLSLASLSPPPVFLRLSDRLCPWSVGVNLSPRLSLNTELYKLKPISLPGLGSSYSGYFIFVYLLSANMPGLLRSSQATGSSSDGDILLARLATREGIPSAYANALIWVPFVYIRQGLRIIYTRVATTYARPFHVYQNVRISMCGRSRRYNSVCTFDAYRYMVS